MVEATSFDVCFCVVFCLQRSSYGRGGGKGGCLSEDIDDLFEQNETAQSLEGFSGGSLLCNLAKWYMGSITLAIARVPVSNKWKCVASYAYRAGCSTQLIILL